MLLMSSADFFKINPFQKIISGILSVMLGNFFMLLMSSADFFKINLFKKFFQEYYQSVKQFGSRSGPTDCRSWSGSKLFAKVISIQQKLPLGRRVKGLARTLPSFSSHFREFFKNWIEHMSRNMRFPTMWYMRPAKAQTSLCIYVDPIRALYSMTVKLLTDSKLKRRLHRLVWVYTCKKYHNVGNQM